MTDYAAHSHVHHTRFLTWLQGGLALSALVWLSVIPTVSRPMILVPVTGAGLQQVGSLAADGDRKLLGTGTARGSLIVIGTPPNPMTAFFRQGILVISAAYPSCSGAAT